MKQVKGTALVEFVKTIRANKSGAYDGYLKDEDREIMYKKVLPMSWYPYETFKRCFNAVFEVMGGKKDPEIVKGWGRLYGELIMTNVFKNTIKKDNPLEHLKRIPVYITSFFDFGKTKVTIESPNRVLMELSDYDPDFAPLYMFLCGWFQRITELCGGKNVQCEFVDMSWVKKSNTTTYSVTWA